MQIDSDCDLQSDVRQSAAQSQSESAICNLMRRDSPRRHGRVLRVGRAARRSVAARQAASPSAASPTGAASSRPPATKRARSACARPCRWPEPCGSARRSSSCRPDFARYKAASNAVFAHLPRGDAARRTAVARRGVSRRDRERRGASRWRRPSRRRLKERIRDETGLTASAGVAPNKFLAKIASGWKKPDGLTVISPERVEPFLQQLPVDALWGVGPGHGAQAARARHRAARRRPHRRRRTLLRETVGSLADWLRQLADGIDDRPVAPNREAKSSGSENTYPAGPDRSRRRFARRSPRWRRTRARWLARKALLARTVTIKVRYCGLHDDHAQPHGAADARRRPIWSRARCNCSTRPRRDGGPSGCSASASTTSAVTPSEPPSPAGCRSTTEGPPDRLAGAVKGGPCSARASDGALLRSGP